MIRKYLKDSYCNGTVKYLYRYYRKLLPISVKYRNFFKGIPAMDQELPQTPPSRLRKVITAITVVSYMVMCIGQSYAMDPRVEVDGYSKGRKLSQVGVDPTVVNLSDALEGEKKDNEGVGIVKIKDDNQIALATVVDAASVEHRLIVQGHPTSNVQEGGLELGDESLEDETNPAMQDRSLAFQVLDTEEDAIEQVQPRNLPVLDTPDDESSEPTLKPFVEEVMRDELSQRDTYLLIAGRSLAGAVCMDEEGEKSLWVQTLIGALSTTISGYRYIYINKEGDNLTDQANYAQLIFFGILLSPYILYRSQQFVDRSFPAAAESNIKTKANNWAEYSAIGTVAVLSLIAAGTTAFQLYSNTVHDFPVYAETITPFVFLFALIDNSLRYADLKESIFKYLFVDRAGVNADAVVAKEKAKIDNAQVSPEPEIATTSALTEATQKAVAAHKAEMHRDSLSNIYQSAKEKISEMTSEEVIARSEKLKQLKGKPVKWIKALMGKEDQVESVQNQTLTASNLQEFVVYDAGLKAKEARRNRRGWIGRVGGGVLGAAAFYLTYKGTVDILQDASQISFSDGIGNIGGALQHLLYLAAFNTFVYDTRYVRTGPEVNGTDLNPEALGHWFRECVNSAEDYQYLNNSIGSKGFSFGYDCPGVSYQTNTWEANPGDLDPEIDEIWYDFMFGYFAGYAGIKNDYNTDDQVHPIFTLEITPAVKGLTIAGGVLRGTASAALTARSVSETIEHIISSFVSHPDEILTGKRNIWMNIPVSILSTMISLDRALPAGAQAWISGQTNSEGTSDNPGLDWTFITAAVLSTAFAMYIDFDDIYSRIPHDIEYSLLSMGLLSKKSPSYLKDEWIGQINKIAAGTATGHSPFVNGMADVFGLNKVAARRRAIVA